MKLIKTAIEDVIVIEPKVFGDERGFFMETYREDWFKDIKSQPSFVQDNHSKSSFGVLRGMHLQTKNTQGKLVRVIQGEVFDVAVDMRIESATYGQWVGEYLSAENQKIFWVPEGFAHGFVVTSETAEFVYKCTNLYDPSSEKSIAWDDATIGIQWPEAVKKHMQLSEKDRKGLNFYHGLGFYNGRWQE